jgi:hypothetical protein
MPEFSVGILHSKHGAWPQTGIFRETGEFIVFAESIPIERALPIPAVDSELQDRK